MEYKGLIVAVVDTKNTNGRIYSMDMMKKAIAEYSEKVNQKRAFGGIGMGAMISRLESQVEYKEEIYALKKKFKDGNERKIYTKLMKLLRKAKVTDVSHLVNKIYLEGEFVKADISLLNTPNGEMVKDMLEKGQVVLRTSGIGTQNENGTIENYKITSCNFIPKSEDSFNIDG